MKRIILLALLVCVTLPVRAGDIAFHAERRAAFAGVVPLARYEPDRGLWGTPLWHIAFELPEGSFLLQTSGHTLIKHLYIPHPQGIEYGLYANCRVALFSAPTPAQLVPAGTVPPEQNVLSLEGMNIRDSIDHYANVPATSQKVISGGAYRIELWCSSGTDAWDVDGLGGIGSYNAGNVHQFNVKVTRLP